MDKKNKIMIFSIVGILLFIIIIFLLIPKESNKNGIMIENSNITILNNSIYSFKALCTDNNCTLNYESSNQDVFVVNDQGDIEAIGVGEAILTIKSNDIEKKVNIYVVDRETMVTDINIIEDNLSLNVGDKYLLEIEIFPTKGTYEDLIWTSSDNDVINLSNGYIEAKNDGIAQVTVSLNDGSIIDKIDIEVGKGATEKVESISFEQEVITMGLNEKYQLSPIIKPINSINKQLTYIVDDSNIISIDDNGLITSKEKGKTNVTILSTNGISTLIEVIVEESNDDLALNIDEIKLSRGETYQLKSNYVTGIEWYSSNNKVATVSSNGLVKAISNGEAIITIVNSYGRINTAKIIVEGSGVGVSSIILNQYSLTLRPGASYKIDAYVLPNNATNKELSYETSDSRVAVVSEDGTIIAQREGEVIITVFANNNVQENMTVTVKGNAVTADSLEINPSSITLLKGDTFNLVANIIPSNASKEDIIWESSNESVVSIDEKGLVTANKTGSVIITASANGLVSKASVEVKNNVIGIQSLTINQDNLTLKVGESLQLTANYLPSNATNKNFIWKSSSDSVSVTNNGLITGVKAGSSEITVSSINGINDKLSVLVIENPTIIVPGENPGENPGQNPGTNPGENPGQNPGTNPGDNPSSGTTSNSVSEVLLNLENINIHIGQTKQLKATVLPLNAVNSSLTWVSSSDSVVTVSSSGLLTGVSPGTAQVSVITANGKVARTNVTVTYPPIYDSGSKLVELYSANLIVTMTKDSSTGIKIIRVWAADPYNQFHKIDSEYETGTVVKSLLNSAISSRGLENSALIGGNAMFTKNRKRIGNFFVTEGNVWHNNPGGPNGLDEASNSLFYAGIASNGMLQIYCTRPGSNCAGGKTTYDAEKPVFDSIISDGVKNSIVLPYECLFINNGKAVDTSWDSRVAMRHTLCQVNTNNFVITISSNGDTKAQHQNIQIQAGCINGINLDGGGSANVFYKDKGSSSVSAIRETTRTRPDAYYFSEY